MPWKAQLDAGSKQSFGHEEIKLRDCGVITHPASLKNGGIHRQGFAGKVERRIVKSHSAHLCAPAFLRVPCLNLRRIYWQLAGCRDLSADQYLSSHSDPPLFGQIDERLSLIAEWLRQW